MPESYDILVIGGGIHGCGIAQHAAASGYKTRLIEMNTIASGTSSQSTKLIHGGLRYLEQVNLKLVYEGLAEREHLLRLAPDLVSREWFYIPVYASSKRPAWMIGAGLLLYWLLSGGRSRFKRVPQRLWSAVLPGLNKKDLKAILAYEDAATDDAALTRAVAASASSFGCVISEHTKLEKAKHDGEIWRVTLAHGEEITTKILINATGAWVNRVSKHIKPAPLQQSLRLVQGSHLMLNRTCPGFIYTESLDGRVMFFRPWQGKTLAGTTETTVTGNPANIKPTADEISHILGTYNHYFPDSPCRKTDIIGTYCGLRVLPESENGAFSASRETVLLCDDETEPSYIAVYGGKLTTYRKESERVLKLIAKSIKAPRKIDTKQIPLSAAGPTM